jgi:hypothetical protein
MQLLFTCGTLAPGAPSHAGKVGWRTPCGDGFMTWVLTRPWSITRILAPAG